MHVEIAQGPLHSTPLPCCRAGLTMAVGKYAFHPLTFCSGVAPKSPKRPFRSGMIPICDPAMLEKRTHDEQVTMPATVIWRARRSILLMIRGVSGRDEGGPLRKRRGAGAV